MYFIAGQQVRLIHTGQKAIVLKWMDAQTVMVRTEDNDEIPVIIEALIDEVAAQAKEKDIQTVDVPLGERIDHKQVVIALDDHKRIDGLTNGFVLWLINASKWSIGHETQLWAGNEQIWTTSGLMKPLSVEKLDVLYADEINDGISIRIPSMYRNTTAGNENIPLGNRSTLKIKSKNLLKAKTFAPLLDYSCWVWTLHDESKPQSSENLSSYEADRQKTLAKKPPSLLPTDRYITLKDLSKMADFPHEIDLHLEALTDDPKSVPTGKILSYQMEAFEDYLDGAIMVGLDRFHVVHGIGSGALKEAVHRVLSDNIHVKSYKNEFHHRYGFGSTEVHL